MRAVIMQGPGFYGVSVWLVADEAVPAMEQKLIGLGFTKQGDAWFPPSGNYTMDCEVRFIEVSQKDGILGVLWDTGAAHVEATVGTLLGLPELF